MRKQVFIVGVISSPRSDGNTAVMVREALKGAKESGGVVKEIFLSDMRLEFCKGCLACMKQGRCCINDDFHEVRNELYKADGIIWGSPTYGAYINAIMKNLFDRLGMFEVSTSSMGGKYMAGISAANSALAAKKVAKYLACFGNNGTFLRSFSSGFLGAGLSGGRTASEEKVILRKARQLGKKVVGDIKKEKKYNFQGVPKRIVSSLIMKPAFSRYIRNNKDGDAKVLYENLKGRNLIV